MKYYSLTLFLLLAAYSAFLNAQQTTYAIIGDFGTGYNDETVVANLVKSWNPQFVITTGDNRYGDHNFDQTIGKDYCEFLAGAESGSNCDGNGSALNAFFPSTGNHDFTDGGGINEYLAYFNLPGAGIQTSGTSGSELYYDFVRGPIHFFVIDSYDAIVTGSMTAQQTWLQNQVEASNARWKIVYFHHPPYTSSSAHESTLPMRWPFAQWGIDVILSGHAHNYERLNYDGITYFINGLGGASIHGLSSPLPGSIIQYNAEHGAQIVVADDTSMTFSFINIHGITIDEHAIFKALPENNIPVFNCDTILETSATEDTSYQNSIGEYASDPDGDSLNYSVISGPSWLSVASNGDLSGTPLNDDVGLNSWIVEVDDGLLGTDSATLQINVFNTNDDPVFCNDTILEASATEDTTYQNSIGEYASDPDGDSLNYSVISGPSWLSVASNGDLSGTPLNEDVGLNSWIVEVDDGLLGTDSATLQINVLCRNADPVSSGYAIHEHAATQDNSETLFIVYPNPVSDRLIVQIKRCKGKKKLILYNISGRAVYAKSVIAEHVEIDVTSFPKGVYILKINYENLNESKEIIIQ